MPLTRGDEPNGAVTMFVVVPVHEARHPLLRRCEALVAVLWVVGPVLASPEQRLREGVVIGDSGAAVRRGDVQPLQCRLERRSLHGGAIISMQHQRLVDAALAQHGALDDLAAVGHGLLVKDLGIDDLAAVDVDDHVEVIELPTHLGR